MSSLPSADQPNLAHLIHAIERVGSELAALNQHASRLATQIAPDPSNIVDSRYVADQLGCTTTWVSNMVRDGKIPKQCLVPGTGNGKLWRFYRARIDQWIESR